MLIRPIAAACQAAAGHMAGSLQSRSFMTPTVDKMVSTRSYVIQGHATGTYSALTAPPRLERRADRPKTRVWTPRARQGRTPTSSAVHATTSSLPPVAQTPRDGCCAQPQPQPGPTRPGVAASLLLALALPSFQPQGLASSAMRLACRLTTRWKSRSRRPSTEREQLRPSVHSRSSAQLVPLEMARRRGVSVATSIMMTGSTAM